MRAKTSLSTFLCGFILVLLNPALRAGNATVAGTVIAEARSSTWIAVEAPLSGDDNHNGYSSFELATSPGGPFSSTGAGWSYLPGPSEWRANHFARQVVLPNATYYIRVTYFDPDGVSGANPQIVGPVVTPSAAPAAVTVEPATALARDTEIFVSVPIRDDSNLDSFGTVEVATSPTGPWVRKCGSTFDRNLPFHPKRCRIRSLTPGTDYWVRVTILDGDGVVGAPNPQVLGPIRYDGLANLALGQPVSADSGWGCCPNPNQLTDGRIQNDAWYFGFAWTGGTSCWAGGCPPGFKQATVDLGSPTRFNRAAFWLHDTAAVALTWKFQYSNDGVNFTDVVSFNEPICRGTSVELPGHWVHPACGHEATFSPVTARYFRYTFDDRTLFRGLHGWAVEIEVFDAPTNQPPQALCRDLTVNAGGHCTANASVDDGSFDPDGDPITLSQAPAGPYPLGTTLVTLTVTDDQGASDSCNAEVTVRDVSAPVPDDLSLPDVVGECSAEITVFPTASDNCAGQVNGSTSDPLQYSDLGTHVVNWTYDDGNGNLSGQSQMVVVQDTNPPQIDSLSASPDALWPPNHRMVPVSVSAAASDNCGGPVACRIVSVSSSEAEDGLGDGETSPDWLITGDLSLQLRAERSGTGSGRTYTVTVECSDEAGNLAGSSVEVNVRHDRGKK